MALIDWILNCAGVLLWLNWRSRCSTPASAAMSLASTLKRAENRRSSPWLPLVSLVALIAARSVFYWNLAPSAAWIPSLELGVIRLPFRSDFFWRTVLFSFLSFGLALAVFYIWLLLISVVNRTVPNTEPIQRLVRLQLGPLESWPVSVKLLLPLLFTSIVWACASPGLVRLGIVPAPSSSRHVWEQAVLLGVSSYLAWKFVVLGLCLLYLVNSYVYLGNSYFWQYVNTTGGNLLHPLRKLPLRVGKIDCSPILGAALVVLVARWATLNLPHLFERLPF